MSLVFAANVPLNLPPWSVAPFALLLLSIALLPLIAPHWWHSNRNRAIVAAAFAIPVVLYLFYVQFVHNVPALAALGHELIQYLAFIFLLGSLYVISGGIVVEGDFRPTPLTNTLFLLIGSVLANIIGTTGASVVLIRPLLRINRPRRQTAHLPVFFIFTVSNLGGLLTPLGDPPLFLGFLNGVPFDWTMALWPVWLVANGSVLAIFFLWDTLAARDDPAVTTTGKNGRFALHGLRNLLFLAGVVGSLLLQRLLPNPWGEIAGSALMAVMAGLSLWLTPAKYRQDNAFTWGPIAEVAILFAGIFVTMVPALDLLTTLGRPAWLHEPWKYFWLTGGLSSLLDNAPTYVTFATAAAGGSDFKPLTVENGVPGLDGPLVLKAISCGAVLMGALTYIGNGPNFMVKAIAEEAGYTMPSFFGYLRYSYCILLPVFVLVTLLFFVR